MKRKLIYVLGLFLCVLFLSGQYTLAKTTQVDKVSISSKVKADKRYYVISAKTRSGKTVWKYKTKKYDVTELDTTTMRTKRNRVYVFENGKMLIFHKQTGKRLVKTKKILKGWQAVFVVDSVGNCYAQSFSMDDVYKISAKGKILWKRNIKKTNLYWPGKMQIKKNTVRIYYDGEGPDSYPEVKGKYIDFDKKTGKILRYKRKNGEIKNYSANHEKVYKEGSKYTFIGKVKKVHWQHVNGDWWTSYVLILDKKIKVKTWFAGKITEKKFQIWGKTKKIQKILKKSVGKKVKVKGKLAAHGSSYYYTVVDLLALKIKMCK